MNIHDPKTLSRSFRLGVAIALIVATAGRADAVVDYDWDAFAAVYETDTWVLDWSPIHGLRVDAHRVIRVNRPSGADAGRIRIWDTFFQKLTEFEGEVRDTTGRVLFRANLDDVRSVAPFREFRLYSGDVVRTVDLNAPQPPYIIEASWTIEIDNPFFWPDWVIADNFPRRFAEYRTAIPKNRDILYQVVDDDVQQVEDRSARRKITAWSITDWIPDQDDTPNGATPLVYVAPVEFRVDGHKGRTDSWTALGEWYWELTKNQLELTDNQTADVDRRVADFVTDRVRASSLKDWVSDDWRYVAIEIGIGGWQPHQAREVYVNRYGDCKDVVFLWVAMLRHLGIESYPALIRARDPLPIDPSFPKDWFDHVVGVAIIDGDTLWADLSDPRYPLGSLPRRCESRWALMVGEFGGQLIKTPSRRARDNWWVASTDAQLTPEGDLDFTSRVIASGHFARRLPLSGASDQSLAVALVLGVMPTAVEGAVESFSVVGRDSVAMQLSGRIHGWALASARHMQMRPRIAGLMAADTIAGRSDPGQIGFPMMVFDTLILQFPPDWLPELWPASPFHSERSGEMGEIRSFRNGTLRILRHLRFEDVGRAMAERSAQERLRRAYREARDADWLFRKSPSDDTGSTRYNDNQSHNGDAPGRD